MIIFNKITKTEAYVELTTENGEKHIIPTSDVIFVNDESGFVSIKNTGSRKTIGLISEEAYNKNPDEPEHYKVWGYLTDGSVYVIEEDGGSVLDNQELNPYRTTMTTANIGTGVTTIGNNTFSNCTSLTSVTIPNSITTIGTNTFEYCSNLISVIIPDSVKGALHATFSRCPLLSKVVIGSGITAFNQYVFFECNALKDIICKPLVPPIINNSNNFYYNDCALSIYVPDDSVAAYKSETTWANTRTLCDGWHYISEYVKPMSEYQE